MSSSARQVFIQRTVFDADQRDFMSQVDTDHTRRLHGLTVRCNVLQAPDMHRRRERFPALHVWTSVRVSARLMALAPEVSFGFNSPGSACGIPETDIPETERVGATTMSKVIPRPLCFASLIESDFITGGFMCQRGQRMRSRRWKYLK